MRFLFFDLRAFALMRIVIAIVILIDCGIRISDLEAFYSNTGVVPLPMLFQNGWNDYYISFHTISGLWQVQFVLFLISFLSGVLLLIGFQTRVVTVLSWCMMVSLHNRNPFILQGGDDLLRMLLFWSMFIPWGDRYSWDASNNKNQLQENQQFSVPMLAYLVQICLMYTGSALLKGPEWDTEFTAVYYVYHLDQIAKPLAIFLAPYFDLLKWFTKMAYYFELWLPVLFFIPFKHSFFRLCGIIMVVGFHLFNEISLFIGLFPLIGIASVIGLLPSEMINVLDSRLKNQKRAVRRLFVAAGRFAFRFFNGNRYRLKSAYFTYVRDGLVIFLLVFVIDWNLSNLKSWKSKMPENLRCIGYFFRLDQSWGMFAPGVFKEDGWYVLDGRLPDGRHVNVMHPERKLSFQKPQCLLDNFKNDRWRKYSEQLLFINNQFLRGYYCNYTRRVWNDIHIDFRIDTLSIYYVKEITVHKGKKTLPEKVQLCQCVN